MLACSLAAIGMLEPKVAITALHLPHSSGFFLMLAYTNDIHTYLVYSSDGLEETRLSHAQTDAKATQESVASSAMHNPALPAICTSHFLEQAFPGRLRKNWYI